MKRHDFVVFSRSMGQRYAKDIDSISHTTHKTDFKNQYTSTLATLVRPDDPP
jgi:hypothetical protein